MITRKRRAIIIILFAVITIVAIATVRGCGLGRVIEYSEDIKAIIYNEKTYYYVPIPGDMVCRYTSSKFLGKTNDGQRVYNVDHTTQFICTRTWDGSPALFSENPEDVFETDVSTGVYLYYNRGQSRYINSAEAANLFLLLPDIFGEAYKYQYILPGSKSVSIYICYNDLPIGTVSLGQIIFINDLWVYTSNDEISKYWDKWVCDADYNEINGVVFADENIIKSLQPYLG